MWEGPRMRETRVTGENTHKGPTFEGSVSPARGRGWLQGLLGPAASPALGTEWSKIGSGSTVSLAAALQGPVNPHLISRHHLPLRRHSRRRRRRS